MISILRDLRIGLRGLLRSPRFSLVAVLVLALGIGVNSAVFGVFDAVLLQPPPVEDPDRLVAVFTSGGGGGNPYGTSSYPDYLDLSERHDVFSGLAAYSTDNYVGLGTQTDTDRAVGHLVSGNFFQVLGVQAAVGRALLPSDDGDPGGHPVAMLGQALARGRFGSRSPVGETMRLNGHDYQVLGVAPQDFSGVRADMAPDLWLPLSQQHDVTPARWGDLLGDRSARWLHMVGRLAPGVTEAQAAAAVEAAGRRLAETYPDSNEGRQMTVLGLQQARVNPAARPALERFMMLLMAVALVVLVITCINVGNLMLVRAVRRQREMSVRLAMGGRRPQLARQLIVESVLLALASSVLGLALVAVFSSLLTRLDLQGAVDLAVSSVHLGLDARLLAFTFAVSLVVGAVLGLIPVVQSWNPDLVSALKEQVGMQGHRRSLLRGGFVVAEVALSCVLLIAAMLFVRSLLNLRGVDVGFRVDNLLIAAVDPGMREYDADRGRRFFRELRQRVNELPQVRGACLASVVPVDPDGSRTAVTLPGQVLAEDEEGVSVDVSSVSPGYFETLGIPLAAGRAFGPTDAAEAPPVAVVNETLARLLWPGGSAVGKQLSTSGPAGPFVEVVGIARNSVYRSLREEPVPYLYRPLAQRYDSASNLVVWTQGEPLAVASEVRRAVRELDPDMPLFAVETQRQHMRDALSRERVATRLLIATGMLALVLAAAGLYGVIAYLVAQRTREIGIRLALGARTADILGLVLRRNLVLIVLGLAVGALAALSLVRTLSSLLYGVEARDPLSFLLVLLLLGAVAALASYLPARRALQVQPNRALRYE